MTARETIDDFLKQKRLAVVGVSHSGRDFTRVLFTTNWGRSGTEEVEMFLIELPPGW